MFIFRRIKKSDSKLSFSTGDPVFNDINPDGTLDPFVNADIISGGAYFTYILLRKSEELLEVYAVLRYRLSNIEEFISELQVCKDIDIELKEIKSTYGNVKYQIVYLSRVGILRAKRNRHLSQVVLNFFDFYLLEMEKNILIYSKVREGKGKFLGPSYKRVASNWDKHWKNYIIVVRTIERQ